MTLETDFFFNSSRAVSRIDGFTISHSSFSRVFYLVRNPNPFRPELPLKHEDGTLHTYQYCPMALKPLASRGDLDYGLSITLGDLGELLPAELDLILAADTNLERPAVVYRSWKSDRLDVPMSGAIRLQVDEITMSRDGSTFEAVAPYLNLTKTGSLYTRERFPMLEGV